MFAFSHRLASRLRLMLPMTVFGVLLLACSLSAPGASVPEIETNLQAAAPLVASVSTVVPTIRSTSAVQPTTQPTQSSVQVVPTVPESMRCQLQTDWVIYVAQANDTLSGIAARTGTNAQTLAQANCLTDMNVISVGQNLYVPSLPAAPTAQPAAPVQPAVVSQRSLAADACVARTTSSAALYSWNTGTNAYVVAQPPADVVLAVNEIGFNGYVSLTYNGATGWADLSSVLLSGECAGLIPAEFTRCLVWAARESFEFNLMVAPEGEPIVMFPARVWIYATAYRPSLVGESAYFGGKGWYKVLLLNGTEGWIPNFVDRTVGNCAALPNDA